MWNDLKTKILDLYAGYHSQDNVQAAQNAKMCSKIIGIMDEMEKREGVLELTEKAHTFEYGDIVGTPEGTGDIQAVLDDVALVCVHPHQGLRMEDDEYRFRQGMYRFSDLTFVRKGISDGFGGTF